MALEVYTNGDFDMIVGAYNGLAMLYDDAGGMYYAAGIVSILALLGWALFKVYDQRASSPTHQFFIGWLVFLTLAGPQSKTSVEITSNRTGQTQTIDNVPFIVAFGGSLSSSLLTTVTEKLKTAFSVVYPIGTPYEVIGNLEPLQAIVKLNEMDYLTTGLCTFQNTQLCENVISYYTYCVQRDQVTGGSKQETAEGNILNASPVDLMDTLKITYSGWSAPYLTTGASVPANYSCPVVYNKIKSLMNTTAFEDLMAKEMEARGIRTEGADRAAAMLTRAAVDGYEVARSRFISQLIARANQNSGVLTGGDVLVAQTEFQAKEQMQAKSAGSAQLFNDMAPVLITAIEFFTLFIAPVTVSLLVVGRYGVTAVTNYLLLMVMTNLWPLCMVGIESFIQFALMSAADGSFDGTSLSINGIGGLIDRVKTYLAVGSVLMVSIPTLSMYILSRNVGSMASLAGSIANNPPVNAHYVAPNLSTAPDAGVSRAGKDVAYSDDMSKSGAVSGRQGLGTQISHSGAVGGTAQTTLSNIKTAQRQTVAQMLETMGVLDAISDSGGNDGSATASKVGTKTKGLGFGNTDSSSLASNSTTQQRENLINQVTTALQEQVKGGAELNTGLVSNVIKGVLGKQAAGMMPAPGVSIGGGTTMSNTNSVVKGQGVNTSAGLTDSNGNTITNSNTTDATLGDIGNRSLADRFSHMGLTNQQAQTMQGLAKTFSSLEAESQAVSNTASSSLQVQNQSTSNTYDIGSRFGRMKQEDFVNGMSDETKSLMMKEGIIDSTGAFSGEFSKMWQERRELNEHLPGMNETQKDNTATIETITEAANKIAAKGGKDHYAAAADIYGTLTNGAKDGSFEGAHDKTLQLIANDYQNLSNMVGSEALTRQALDAGNATNITEDVNQQKDTTQFNIDTGSADIRQQSSQRQARGENAKTDPIPENTFANGAGAVGNDHKVAQHYQQQGEPPKGATPEQVTAVYPINSPKANIPGKYQEAADKKEKREADIATEKAKAERKEDPNQVPENIPVPSYLRTKEEREEFIAKFRANKAKEHDKFKEENSVEMKTSDGRTFTSDPKKDQYKEEVNKVPVVEVSPLIWQQSQQTNGANFLNIPSFTPAAQASKPVEQPTSKPDAAPAAEQPLRESGTRPTTRGEARAFSEHPTSKPEAAPVAQASQPVEQPTSKPDAAPAQDPDTGLFKVPNWNKRN